MEILVVDTEGKIVIPPEIIQKHGLRPGDELALLETAQGLIVCQKGLALLEDWWNSLTEEDKVEARKEAEWYESLTEEERDATWNQFSESIEEENEGDEIDIATFTSPAR